MATADRPGTERRNERPEGAQPKRKSQREDERIRDEAQADTDGDAPIDPADEAFIESNQKS